MRAKYYISFNAGVDWSEFWPSNTPVIKLTLEPQEAFKRWRVDSFRIGRTKNTTVFDILYGMFYDKTDFATDIKYKVNELGVDTYLFIGPVLSGNMDDQNSMYEVNPEPDDLYRPILQKYQKKFDNTSLIFGYANNMYYPVLASSLFANSTFDTFTDITKTVNYTHTGAVPGEQVAGNDITNTPNGAVVTVIIKNLSYTGTAPTMVLVDAPAGTEYSNKVTINANGKYELLMTGAPATIQLEFSVINVSGVSRSGSFDYEVFNPTALLAGALLHDILNTVVSSVNYMNLSYNVVSTILWNDALGSDPPASIDTYITGHATNDYVLEASAQWNYLWLMRVDSLTTDKEENIPLSLKDLMDLIKLKMRCWWFVDEDGDIRIEHEKYFKEYDPQLNVTLITADKPEVDARKYAYDRSDLYNQVSFTENNMSHEDWIDFAKIEYAILTTSLNVKEINLQNLTTDIKYVIEYPDDAVSNGLMLLRLDSHLCVVFEESMVTAGDFYPNQKLSWRWLNDFYMDYYAEAGTGTNGEGAHTFIHVKEFLKQNKVKFRTSTALVWYKPLTLLKGTGWIDELEYTPETGMYSVNVAYDPYSL